MTARMFYSALSPIWRALLQVGHATIYGLVPLFTLGQVYVEEKPFKVVLLRRTPHGIVLGGYVSAFLGALLWVLLISVGLSLFEAGKDRDVPTPVCQQPCGRP